MFTVWISVLASTTHYDNLIRNYAYFCSFGFPCSFCFPNAQARSFCSAQLRGTTRLHNRAEELAYHKNYYKVNKSAIAAKNKDYYQRHKEKIALKRKTYYEERKDAIQIYNKSYRVKASPERRKKAAQYRLENREKISEAQRMYRLENKKARSQYISEYNEKHKHELKQKLEVRREKYKAELEKSRMEITVRNIIFLLIFQKKLESFLDIEELSDWYLVTASQLENFTDGKRLIRYLTVSELVQVCRSPKFC